MNKKYENVYEATRTNFLSAPVHKMAGWLGGGGGVFSFYSFIMYVIVYIQKTVFKDKVLFTPLNPIGQ